MFCAVVVLTLVVLTFSAGAPCPALPGSSLGAAENVGEDGLEVGGGAGAQPAGHGCPAHPAEDGRQVLAQPARLPRHLATGSPAWGALPVPLPVRWCDMVVVNASLLGWRWSPPCRSGVIVSATPPPPSFASEPSAAPLPVAAAGGAPPPDAPSLALPPEEGMVAPPDVAQQIQQAAAMAAARAGVSLTGAPTRVLLLRNMVRLLRWLAEPRCPLLAAAAAPALVGH